MGNAGDILFIGVFVAVAIVVWGAFKSGRSVTVAVVALLVAAWAAGGCWYVFAEIRSVPWTIGYGVVSLMSLGVGVKNLIGTRYKPEE